MTGKRIRENDIDEHVAKKSKQDNTTQENLPLSKVKYYKNEIFKLIQRDLSLSPDTIFLNLILKNCEAKVNLFVNPKDKINFLNFSKQLMRKLTYPVEIFDPPADQYARYAQRIPNTILFINNFLKDAKLEPGDEFFSLLISHFYYFMDHYRNNYYLNIDDYPDFKEKVFLPLEAYKRNQVTKQVTQSANLFSTEINNKIFIAPDKSHWNIPFSLLKQITSDNEKQLLLIKLLKMALTPGSKRMNPLLESQRQQACLGIEIIGLTKNIEEYFKSIVLPLYEYNRDHFVRSLGCRLMGKIFPLVSPTLSELIFVKLLESLKRYKMGKEEVRGACLAFSTMNISQDQKDKILPSLKRLSRSKIQQAASKAISFLSASEAIAKEDEQYIFEKAITLLNLEENKNYTPHIYEMLLSIRLIPNYLEQLQKVCLNNWEFALRQKNILLFRLTEEVIEKLSLKVPINLQAINEKDFPNTHLAILLFEKLNAPLTLKQVIFLDYIFHKLRNKFLFYTEAKKISNEKKIDHPKNEIILNELKILLEEGIKKLLDSKSMRFGLMEEVTDHISHFLDILNPKQVQNIIYNIIIVNENRLFKEQLSYIDYKILELSTNTAFVFLKKLLGKQFIENSIENFNFLSFLESENEIKFSHYRHHLIQFLRQEMGVMVKLNLVATKHELPTEITTQIRRYVYA